MTECKIILVFDKYFQQSSLSGQHFKALSRKFYWTNFFFFFLPKFLWQSISRSVNITLEGFLFEEWKSETSSPMAVKTSTENLIDLLISKHTNKISTEHFQGESWTLWNSPVFFLMNNGPKIRTPALAEVEKTIQVKKKKKKKKIEN